MSSHSPASIGNAVISKIELEHLDGERRKLHGHYVKISKPDEDLDVARDVPIIPEKHPAIPLRFEDELESSFNPSASVGFRNVRSGYECTLRSF